MAKYSFKCPHCNEEKTTYSYSNVPLCSCGKEMIRKLPSLNGPTDVKETVDPYTNTQWSEDHKATVQQRNQDFFWRYEVPRLVDSGIYSVETMLENGWITMTEKGDFVINDKPPRRR
jgi:hypothetical protein